jgi:hypothetical protein
MTHESMMTGAYRYENGSFVPDRGMQAINERISSMRLLSDIEEGRPSFYFDPADGSYWEGREFEDYRRELRQVDRQYIRANFPTVDPDRFV